MKNSPTWLDFGGNGTNRPASTGLVSLKSLHLAVGLFGLVANSHEAEVASPQNSDA
jgi:hypothetical protein